VYAKEYQYQYQPLSLSASSAVNHLKVQLSLSGVSFELIVPF
jgi:hypothetical protein